MKKVDDKREINSISKKLNLSSIFKFKFKIETKNNEVPIIKVNTAWRTDEEDDIAVHMYKGDIKFRSFELGLCPEDAYKKMIDNHMKNLNNEEFWKEQNKQDLFIHSILENAI